MENKKNNTGDYNTGDCNTGNRNTGDYNTGDWNTGNWNTGDCNTGDCNTGNRNTGDYNTGDWNTGNWNTGDCNTGNRNTGNWNTGNWNTGDCNTGNSNTGNYNTGNRNTGFCNTITPKVMIFNKNSDIIFETDLYYKIYNIFDKYSKPLCEWISANKMTDKEKQDNKTWETTQGYLKVNEIRSNGIDVTQEDEEFIRNLPNFDEQILLECTGIDLTKKKVKISIDGKDILISKEEFESIKKQFMQ